VAAAYRSRAAYHYVRVKLWLDPMPRRLFEIAADKPFGRIADVGCGRGQMGLLLLRAALADEVFGLDWDARKVAVASAAARGLAARFETADVRAASLPRVDTVLLLDVLHYLLDAEQEALLRQAARAAARYLVVRDLDAKRGAPSWITRGWEWVTTTAGYNRGRAGIATRPFEAMASLLENEGFHVTREPCSARGLANVLLFGERR